MFKAPPQSDSRNQLSISESPQMRQLEKIMTLHERPIPLSKDICGSKCQSEDSDMEFMLDRLTHRYTETTDDNLQTCDDHKRLQHSRLDEPFVSTPRQAKAEDVLENEQASKCFHGDFS